MMNAATPRSEGRRRSLAQAKFSANPLGDEDPKPASAPPSRSFRFRPASLASNCAEIKEGEFRTLLSRVADAESNEARVQLVQSDNAGKLFTCDQLKELMETTPSVKTRIAILESLAPQLSDPKSGSSIISMFRFAEEQRRVERAMKLRDQELSSARYTAPTKAQTLLRARSGRSKFTPPGTGALAPVRPTSSMEIEEVLNEEDSTEDA